MNKHTFEDIESQGKRFAAQFTKERLVEIIVQQYDETEYLNDLEVGDSFCICYPGNYGDKNTDLFMVTLDEELLELLKLKLHKDEDN